MATLHGRRRQWRRATKQTGRQRAQDRQAVHAGLLQDRQGTGYIKSYPPGVRENGGQYTHAATWFVIALAEMGQTDEAYRCFSMLNPVNHAIDEASAELYRVEPYVVAADVYAGDDTVGNSKGGRGGWTWYTGSAGWLYRAAVEGILGIERRGKRVQFTPRTAQPLGRLFRHAQDAWG